MNAHLPKPVSEEKEVKAKDEEKKAEKEGEKIVDDKVRKFSNFFLILIILSKVNENFMKNFRESVGIFSKEFQQKHRGKLKNFYFKVQETLG